MTRRRPSATGLLVAALMGGGALLMAPGFAQASEKNLSVPAYKQEQSNWCWATVIQSIVKFKTGSSVSQCTIVKRGRNSSSCPNSAGNKAQEMRALYQSGVNSGTQVVLNWDYVTSEINVSRAIYSSITWRSGGGHAHVLRGYYNTGYSYGVSYIDPASGTTTSREWGNYQNNTSWTSSDALIHLYAR